MRRSRSWLLSLLLLAVPLGCATPRTGEDFEVPALWVDPVANVQLERGTRDEPFKTLDGALRHAQPETRIHLSPGTYRVNLKVDRQLVLLAEDPAKRPVLRAADARRPVIELLEKAGASLTNLEIGGGIQGVRVGRKAVLEMSGCTVQENSQAGIAVAPSRTFWSPAPLSSLDSCTLTGNGVGLSMEDGAVSLVKCTIVKNRMQGIACRGNSFVNVVAGHVNENGAAGMLFDLGRKSGVTVTLCDVRTNGEDGLRIVRWARGWLSTSEISIKENSLSGNRGWGLAVIDGATGKPTAIKATVDPIRLEENQFSGNVKGMASGIEAR